MLVGKQTLFGELAIIAEFCRLGEYVGIDRNGLPSYDYSLRGRMVVETVEFVVSDFR